MRDAFLSPRWDGFREEVPEKFMPFMDRLADLADDPNSSYRVFDFLSRIARKPCRLRQISVWVFLVDEIFRYRGLSPKTSVVRFCGLTLAHRAVFLIHVEEEDPVSCPTDSTTAMSLLDAVLYIQGSAPQLYS
ncbi:unnamed protein product [Cercospora beticola]|nr:unnamed protein product [Cercospora beticola]